MIRGVKTRAWVFALSCPVLLFVLFLSDAFSLWAKRFDTGGNDTGLIWPAEDGTYYLWSIAWDLAGSGRRSLIVSKLDNAVSVRWSKKIYIGDYDDLAIIPIEGGFFVSGTTKATADDPGDMIWAKLDRNLTQLYGKILEGVREESIVFEPTDDGGWIGSGSTNSYGAEGDRDILILKIDSSGNVQWGKVFNHGPGDDSATILEVPDGYMLCGSVVNATSGGQDILVAKLNHSGVPQWAKLYGGTGISAAVMRKYQKETFFFTERQKPVLRAMTPISFSSR